MKNQADKKRTERTSELGEAVFIKLQPYVQSSIHRRSNAKLAFRYFCPYNIIRCINPVAYEVGLPPESKIHPVFHVSQLRKVLKPGTSASTTLPIITDVLPAPVNILGHRWRQTPSGRHEQVQVQWSPDANEDVTWEDKLELQHKFPEALAWGQANTQGGGDVSVPVEGASGGNDMGLTHRQVRPKRLRQPNMRHIRPEWTT